MRLPSFASVSSLGLALCLSALSACGIPDEPPKTPREPVGEPSPKAVTSAEPLWLSNDPGRAKPPAAVAR